MSYFRTETRLPTSGNPALAAGALIQAALGAEFVFAGLAKVVAPNYTQQFRAFIEGSAGATNGPLAPLIQILVVPNIDVVAQVARFTELIAGIVLVLSALEVAQRRFAGPSEHWYEPLVALASAVAACVVGGLSLSIYLVQGGQWPTVNPDFAFASPIAIELLIVPMAVAAAWLELDRFLARRSTPSARRRLPSR
ncbi:MAG TPA: hypothetical protein VGJ60_25590 [Chloroflexota bacterium]|jgi:hypothetical protein